MEIKLAILKGFGEEKDVLIRSVPFEVGRSRLANLIIPHMNVSRKHCVIVKENESWKVNDWSSSGTFVNDILVGKGKSTDISDGDSIRLGPVESELCWKFNLLSDGNSIAKCETKVHVLLKLNSEKEERSVEGKNVCEVKTSKKESKNNEKPLKLQDDSEKIQQLEKELQQMQSALNNIEEQNSLLQEKLATEMKNKSTNLTSKILENLTDVMETEMQCTICSELFVTAVTLCCSHTFCKYCIDQWKKKQKTCPICRKKITKETRSLVLDNYIDKIVGSLSVELKQRRDAIIEERKGMPTKKRKYFN